MAAVNIRCHLCSKTIQGLPADPLISAKSLGWKNFHMVCATKWWGKMPERKEKRTRFRIDCRMIEHAKPTTFWNFFTDTLEDAEDICRKQMSPDALTTTNRTSEKFVNCIITLVMKDGGKTIVDEKINPVSSLSTAEGKKALFLPAAPGKKSLFLVVKPEASEG